MGFITTSPNANQSHTLRRLASLARSSLIGLLLAACTGTVHTPAPPTPTASPPPPAVVNAITAETLPNLVILEREASITGNLPLLATLWAEDALIVDGRGTVSTGDDYQWQGRAAILDRYTMAVFPAPPPPLTLPDLAAATVNVEGDQATLINGGDSWRFVHRDGRWWLLELTYSAP